MSFSLVVNIQSPSTTAYLFPGKKALLTRDPGQSGSFPLLLNTTWVSYEYTMTHVDNSAGVMEVPDITDRFYTVATGDTTRTVMVIVAGDSTWTHIGYRPTFTETLPPGVTLN